MLKFHLVLIVFLTFEAVKGASDHVAKAQKQSTIVEVKSLRRAATLGIGIGMMNVQKKMEENVLKLFENFTKTVENSKVSENVARKKLKELERTMKRDKYAIKMLQNAMDFSMNPKTMRNYRQTFSGIDEKAENFSNSINSDMDVKKVQDNVNNHLKFMRDKISSVRETLKKLERNKKPKISFTSSKPTAQLVPHMNGNFNHDIVRLPQLLVPMIYDIDVESFYRFRRQNEDDNEETNRIDIKKESQEDFDANDAPSSAGGGGIGGLFAGLSGGEGGSDVGALVGAISGVVTNLFGPGGLDLPTLISSGTSLLAGLLGGDENFGKVLANYVGLAVEGFSGGGGADNNGVFFGSFLGTLLSQLSADPEEEAGPQPKIFFDNFFKGFEQTKQKRGTDESSSSSKGYFFEFISNIISSIVGGITNLLLNSSLGSSGGSSQGSADLSAGSSQGSHTGSAHASQSSMPSSMHSEHKPK